MLDVTQRLVVIIGGGAVAARKAKGLVDAGATCLRVVAPMFDENMPATVERVAASYGPAHIDGAGLVFAATDAPDVNETVVRDARARGVLVSRVDDGDAGDFATPAVFRDGPVTVAVSSGSAALSVAIRDALAERLDPRWARMAELIPALRRAMDSAGFDVAERARIFRRLATEEALEVLDRKGTDALIAWAMQSS
jgi:precorrin-2 dehydrogenase/sirohydrochlorin ferrochelatase